MDGIINFVKSPEIANIEASKKAKLSSRSYGLIKKAGNQLILQMSGRRMTKW